MRFTRMPGILALAIVASLAVTAQATTIFSDDFESYADTAAMNAVWNNGGSATLDTGLGNPGNSMSHPGTSGSFSGENTNSISFGPIVPVGSEVLSYSADIYDDGTSGNKRVTAGLRAAAAANLVEMGMYNDPTHYSYRTILFGSPNGGGNWAAFADIVDDSGVAIDNAPVEGWHRYNVEITGSSATFTLDLNSDGNINATAVVPVDINPAGFDIIRLGGPSDLSSAGGGANFDNVSLTFIPEPATWLLVCMGGGLAAAIRRRR